MDTKLTVCFCGEESGVVIVVIVSVNVVVVVVVVDDF